MYTTVFAVVESSKQCTVLKLVFLNKRLLAAMPDNDGLLLLSLTPAYCMEM